MPRISFFKKKAAPPKDAAEKLAQKDFLFLSEIVFLMGIPKEGAQLVMHQAKLRPYSFEAKDGKVLVAYLTCKVKKVLAARGRIIPGFNEDMATSRQWQEMLDSALAKPLDSEWYFQPVNPDPLLRTSEQEARDILVDIISATKLDGDPSEVLRYIADIINDSSRKLTITAKTF